MKIQTVLLLSVALCLAACGPKGQHRKNTSFSGTTGFSDKTGDFVANGDLRVEEALRRTESQLQAVTPAPVSNPNTTQTPKLRLKNPLSEKLKEFEISRFHSGTKEPSRFGASTLELKIIFQNKSALVFRNVKMEGAKPNFTVKAVNGRFSLTGSLDDFEEQSHDRFILTDLKTKETAEILLWAYRANLKLRPDRTKKIPVGSKVEKYLKSLSEDTFGWVNNWNVVNGPSSYLNDIVHVVRGKTLPPERGSILSLKGESRRTGVKTYKAETDNKDVRADLFGNGEDTAGRMFQVTIKDDTTNEDYEFMLDVQPDEKVVAPGTKPEETFTAEEPEEIAAAMAPVSPPAPVQQSAPTVEPAPPSQPVQATPVQATPPVQSAPTVESTPPAPSVQPAPPVQPPPAVEPAQAARPMTPTPAKPAPVEQDTEETIGNYRSFLRVDTSRPRTAKMTRDFNQNRNLKRVIKWMKTYQGGYRAGLELFYEKAAPFRRILEAVGSKFDVSPVFAYVTVIESYYFTKGRYEIEGSGKSSALGAFQLLFDTAKEMGLYVTKDKKELASDERRFFVPSSCGAAKYFRKLVNKFGEGDSTLGILGYNQGDGGAAAAIYCTFDANAGNRKACADRINSRDDNFSRAEYGRFLNLYKKYDYTYAEMDRMAAISEPMRDYVTQKLAIYFISNDMAKYGFQAGTGTRLPKNNTVMPKRDLKDSECQEAVRGIPGL